LVSKPSFLVDGLGLCEHCGALLSVENLCNDAMNGVWGCPKCGKVLTGKTFGYEDVDGKPKKTKWVGRGKKWVDERPEKPFDLGGWHIVLSIPRFRF
jgi:hypothetical protein